MMSPSTLRRSLEFAELDGTIRRVVACDRDQVLVQAVVCQRERQPPTPKPSALP
jgi:hypothetical protein